MDDPAGPSRRPRRRTSSVVAATAIVLAGMALVGGGLATRAKPAPSVVPSPSVAAQATPLPTPAVTTVGYLVPPADLADRAAKASKGVEPWASAKADLLKDADRAIPPAPHPAASLDIPDTEGPFVDDTATAYGLALAYSVTGDVRYAEAARDYIMAWVGTTKRLLNVCPDDGACQTSLIVGRVAPGFVFAADLIRPADVMTAADEAAFRDWLRDLILPGLSERPSNWGDAGNFSRAVITDYLGDTVGFAKALDEWKQRIDLIQADGHIPEEVRRGDDGMSYTQEALQYKLAVARLAELRGVDLWTLRRQGRRIAARRDRHAPELLVPARDLALGSARPGPVAEPDVGDRLPALAGSSLARGVRRRSAVRGVRSCGDPLDDPDQRDPDRVAGGAQRPVRHLSRVGASQPAGIVAAAGSTVTWTIPDGTPRAESEPRPGATMSITRR